MLADIRLHPSNPSACPGRITAVDKQKETQSRRENPNTSYLIAFETHTAHARKLFLLFIECVCVCVVECVCVYVCVCVCVCDCVCV